MRASRLREVRGSKPRYSSFLCSSLLPSPPRGRLAEKGAAFPTDLRFLEESFATPPHSWCARGSSPAAHPPYLTPSDRPTASLSRRVRRSSSGAGVRPLSSSRLIGDSASASRAAAALRRRHVHREPHLDHRRRLCTPPPPRRAPRPSSPPRRRGSPDPRCRGSPLHAEALVLPSSSSPPRRKSARSSSRARPSSCRSGTRRGRSASARSRAATIGARTASSSCTTRPTRRRLST